MLIRVMYPNGKFDMVSPHLLDSLLEQEKVSGFMRSDGWVSIGKDPLRKSDKVNSYTGPERRHPLNTRHKTYTPTAFYQTY